jgi:hypothetical protein
VANIGIARAVSPEQGLAIMSSIEDSGAAAVITALGLLALPLGLILLAFAVWRAGAVAIWVPLVVLAAFAVVTVAEGMLGGVVGDALMFAGLGSVGLRLLRPATHPA